MSADSSQEHIATTTSPAIDPFQSHVELLSLFLTRRETIVESIETILNAQRKPLHYLQNQPLLSRHFEDCFFQHAVGKTHLRGQLETAYWAMGYKPRQLPGLHNDLIHPADMMVRAFHFWQQTRWPGRSGRMHYAQTLFNVYLIRCLEFLSMRLWDDATHESQGSAGVRLTSVQGLLDQLWKTSPADQPVIVRDARWLIPLAQSLPTDEVAIYLETAQKVTQTLSEADALEVQKAHVRMLGGHLTSQIRHYSTKDGVSIDEPSVVLRTRTTNALDFALLVQGLVALLKAYEGAVRSHDQRTRLGMAGAILQGISPDPELFLNRIDLLSAHTMLELVLIETDSDGHAAYSPLGRRHVQLLEEYGASIVRLAAPLRDDLPHFKPVTGAYSAYGVIFGTPSVLTELMAFKTLQRDAETRFTLEDVFTDGVAGDENIGAAKLAWVDSWRKLPHIAEEVQRQYDYPQQFAEDIYARIERELNLHQSEMTAATRTGLLYVASQGPAIPELPARYFYSSDQQIVAAHLADPYDQAQLLRERQEGHFLVSYKTGGGWMALKRDLLTEIIGAGHDAAIAGLPPEAVQVLRLMCNGLVSDPANPNPLG